MKFFSENLTANKTEVICKEGRKMGEESAENWTGVLREL